MLLAADVYTVNYLLTGLDLYTFGMYFKSIRSFMYKSKQNEKGNHKIKVVRVLGYN